MDFHLAALLMICFALTYVLSRVLWINGNTGVRLARCVSVDRPTRRQ